MPTVPLALAAALAFLAASRVLELKASARNEARLRSRGGFEAPGVRFRYFIALHAVFPLALIAEVVGCGTRPGDFWLLWLTLWMVGEGLRAGAMRTLGDRWTARLYVVPGERRVRRGLYRYLAHPNYLGVVLELAALPLLFGAWRTALAMGIANALLLALRIRDEERALSIVERTPFDLGTRSE